MTDYRSSETTHNFINLANSRVHLFTQPWQLFIHWFQSASTCNWRLFPRPIYRLEARESFANMDFCRFDFVFSAPDSLSTKWEPLGPWAGWGTYKKTPSSSSTFHDVDDGRMKTVACLARAALHAVRSRAHFPVFPLVWVPYTKVRCVRDALSIHPPDVNQLSVLGKYRSCNWCADCFLAVSVVAHFSDMGRWKLAAVCEEFSD